MAMLNRSLRWPSQRSAISRWPVLETGRNSVMPSMMPSSSAASRSFMAARLWSRGRIAQAGYRQSGDLTLDISPKRGMYPSILPIHSVFSMTCRLARGLRYGLYHPDPARSHAMSFEHIEKLIKDHKVEFVDLRFVDMRGVEQHVTFPVSIVEPALFEDGKMFDGSSIAGWKGINESDMVLLPDPDTAYLDPFYADPTLVLSCDILDPATMQGYSRCPRGVAKRAEAYLKSTGIADMAFFGPEPEFFIFDSIRFA